MTIGFRGLIISLLLLAAGTAGAVPCGDYATYGGVAPSVDCRSGEKGSRLRDDPLNAGSFFGFSDWTLLNRSKAGGDASGAAFWTVERNGRSYRSGTFTLQPDLWNTYSSLAVVLRGGRSSHDRTVKWGAYLLPEGADGTFAWSFDGGHKRLGRLLLFGRVDGPALGQVTNETPVPVSEPPSWLLLALGLLMLGLWLPRRRAAVR